MKWKDGDSYTGAWKDGKKHGKGIYKKVTGEGFTFDGNYFEDQKVG